MGWETRKRGGRYFYQSTRVNGQPRKIYLGRGPEAQEEADRVEERRQARRAEQQVRQQGQALTASAERLLVELKASAAVLVQAALHEAGFHRHHGEWRRPRKNKEGQG